MQINFIIFLISFINNIYSKEDELYTPYSDYNNPSKLDEGIPIAIILEVIYVKSKSKPS